MIQAHCVQVTDLVGRDVFRRHGLLPRRRRLQLPEVEAVEEELGEVEHHLPVVLRQVTELEADEVGDGLRDARFLERRRALHKK